MAASIRLLLEKHGVDFLELVVRPLQGQPVDLVRDDAKYRLRVVAPAWDAAPLQVRLQDRESLRWDDFCFALRDRLFDTSGSTIALGRDWQAAVTATSREFASGDERLGLPEAEAKKSAPPPTEDIGPPPAVGIDLGTTYSVVAHLDHQGRPTSIPNASGDILTPSVVLFDRDGTIVGKEAVLAAALEPEKVADCVKRDMGSKQYRKKINGEYLPPEVISSYVLRRLRADAERKLGPVTKAVITVPAYFDETRRRATMDAGRLAGLDVLDILNEPTAAAITYGYQEGFLDKEGRVKSGGVVRVLVYDLGGGTFDVTVVEMSDQSFKAIATDGDVRLGGKDWDEKLVEIAARRLEREVGRDPRTDAETLQDLWTAAELAKKTLSERPRATMYVNHRGKRHKLEVTRDEFEEATAPLVLRTKTTTEIVVMQAGFTWGQIDKVLVVGGSTRMPMIL
ncbi:MAG TPA: Hsp70 family protein, partial [Pirellulales bacterium]|nr:Hsp70 family protein [Pirellulales bacterium]